ncbi:hypothetical protein I4F81_001393 [Pyropia yezoensis]|uniref:Uncharacterized protein n=1 Tax=Pyropia yezoensis TaxID=2788 RepID=A0ACC3BMF3_PYRYE|nr:hypothetical protein I4F81_001393 [Neopyropia yezoensis]
MQLLRGDSAATAAAAVAPTGNVVGGAGGGDSVEGGSATQLVAVTCTRPPAPRATTVTATAPRRRRRGSPRRRHGGWQRWRLTTPQWRGRAGAMPATVNGEWVREGSRAGGAAAVATAGDDGGSPGALGLRVASKVKRAKNFGRIQAGGTGGRRVCGEAGVRRVRGGGDPSPPAFAPGPSPLPQRPPRDGGGKMIAAPAGRSASAGNLDSPSVAAARRAHLRRRTGKQLWICWRWRWTVWWAVSRRRQRR